MAAATEYATPPPPPLSNSSSVSIARSPDTASPIYPERAIRPLPKSRLKSKLSPEQVNSIIYPPDPANTSPPLSFSPSDGVAGTGRLGPAGREALGTHYTHLHQHAHTHSVPEHDHCTCGDEGDSGDEDVEFDHPEYRYATPPSTTNGAAVAGKAVDNVQRRLMEAARLSDRPMPPGSATSSADGYESFENTSNKKKRKIPLSGSNSIHQSQLSAEMASMGISTGPPDHAVGTGDLHGSGSANATDHQQLASASFTGSASGGTGISGAGRGRFGRQNARDTYGVRRPLASSSSNISGIASRFPRRASVDVKYTLDRGIENRQATGIISQAIKSAAEQGPLTPQKGHENASLLSAAASSSTPTSSKTQFTFAMESESGSKLSEGPAGSYPQSREPNGVPLYGRGNASAQSAHSTSAHPGQQGATGTNGSAGRPTVPPVTGNGQQPPPPPTPKPKPRRRPSKEYALAARQRRRQQEYTNYHHRPNKDNMWICEFCEYEDIFGVPPVALIRQYEIKDRAERKRAAEKRRLLEKARAKGRKGKKGGKNKNITGHSHGTAASASAHDGHYDPNMPPEGDDFYDEDYDGDEYEPVGDDDNYSGDYYPTPPPPTGTPHPLDTGGAVPGRRHTAHG